VFFFAFLAGAGLPAWWLTYLTMLARPVPASGNGAAPTLEWYPAGRTVIAAALIAGCFATLTLFLLGGDIDTLRSALRGMLQTFVDNELPKMPDAPKLGPADIDEATGIALALLPAASAISTMGSLLFNLWLAGRITMASGRLQRPWPDLPAMVYPPTAPLMLAAATAAGFLAGLPGMIAAGFAGPLLFSYVLLGLAVVHYTTRGRPWRPFALWGLYASLFIMNTIASLAIALLGLAEAIWPMRKLSPPPDEPPST
jgi:hypothetical protein